ncbi:rolling circle replication-associated protein [Clostridium sardiniense]|uniref:rolling circle replication-associated protein n=1 Tax=Clostridium sardiniense TaxID=29369 RepID=UPI003D32C169
MPYREKRIYSGNMLEIEIFPISFQERKHSRKRKEKESLTKQKNLNDKNAKKHLIRLLNTNFTDKDLSVTLTYDNENLPQSEEEARKDVINFLRRVKRYVKRNNLPDLKYIAVIEYREQKEGKKAIRLHHHIVMSGDIDRDKVEDLWKKGRANADRLKADEFGYEGLARYISKDPKGQKRWTQSRNLKQPIVKVNDFKYSKRKVNELSKCQGDRQVFESLYKNYSFRDYKIYINDITAGTYLYIKMQKFTN